MPVQLISTLLTQVKRRVSIPDGSPTDTDATLLSFAQESLTEEVWPWLIALNEEFCIVEKTIPMVVSGIHVYPQAVIPFPARAFGRNFREVKYLDTAGNVFNCPLANLEDRDLFLRSPSQYGSFSGAPAFYVLGDQIQILALAESVTGSFWLTFPVQPPALVSSATLATDIVNIAYASGTTTFTVSTTGADFNTYCPDTSPDTVQRFDLFRRASGSILRVDLICTRTGATTLTTTDLSENEANNLKTFQQGESFTNVAEYTPSLVLMPAEQNNYFPLPQELETVFILTVAGRYLESVGDTEGLQVNELKLKKAEGAAGKALGKRITGECKVITNRRGVRAHLTTQSFRRGW